MLKFFKSVITTCCLVLIFGVLSPSYAEAAKAKKPEFTVLAHVENLGDVQQINGGGTAGSNLRLEGLKISLADYNKEYSYRVKFGGDWTGFTNSAFAGSRGESKGITAVEFQTKKGSKLEKNFDIYIRAHITTTIGESVGYTEWTRNGMVGVADTLAGFYLDGFEICVCENGKKPKDETDLPGFLCISPFQTAVWATEQLNITQTAFTGSHYNYIGLDSVSSSRTFRAPYDCKIVSSEKSYGRISIESIGPVHLSDDTLSYVSNQFLHCSNTADYKPGQIIRKNEFLCAESGVGASGLPNEYAVHLETRCANYTVAEQNLKLRSSWNYFPYNFFFIPTSVETINEGEYRGLWKYRADIPVGATPVNGGVVRGVITKKAPIRTNAAEVCPVVKYLNKGDTIDIYAQVVNGYDHTWYYTTEGWIYEGNVELSETLPVSVSGIVLPSNIPINNIFIIKGIITPTNGPVNITIRCINDEGKVFFSHSATIRNAANLQNSEWDRAATFNKLPYGSYTVQILADDVVVAQSSFNVS